MEQECSNCYFMRGREFRDINSGEPYNMHFCRRQQPGISVKGYAQWPVVRHTDWCGEWKKKE